MKITNTDISFYWAELGNDVTRDKAFRDYLGGNDQLRQTTPATIIVALTKINASLNCVLRDHKSRETR